MPMPARSPCASITTCASILDEGLERAMTREGRAASRKVNCLVAVTLDENSIGRSNPDIEHERAVAIYDLIEENAFTPQGDADGPFALHLSVTGTRLVFD